MNLVRKKHTFTTLLLAGALLGSVAHGAEDAKKTILIGVIGKSQSNPVFQAARVGAEDAARELGPKYGVEVKIDWKTPADEDAQKQAQAIEQLARNKAHGIAVSCSDANTCTPAINIAVEMGSTVVCFDSDAPRSKRLCYYGTDDIPCGEKVMKELATIMKGKGTIAILAGNPTAPNLQKRVEGVKKVLAEYPGMKLMSDGVCYHKETPEESAAKVAQIQSAHPEIQGWAFVGGWPLFVKNALPWEPGKVKVVSVDALPAEISYIKSGHVQTLYAQDCYGWGHKSVELLLEKIMKGKSPEQIRVIDPLTSVTAGNADAFMRNWDAWLKK